VPFLAVRGQCFSAVLLPQLRDSRGGAERACKHDLPKLQPGSRSKNANISAPPRDNNFEFERRGCAGDGHLGPLPLTPLRGVRPGM